MSDDHIGVKVNGVLYVKLEDARKLRQGWDEADKHIDEWRDAANEALRKCGGWQAPIQEGEKPKDVLDRLVHFLISTTHDQETSEHIEDMIHAARLEGMEEAAKIGDRYIEICEAMVETEIDKRLADNIKMQVGAIKQVVDTIRMKQIVAAAFAAAKEGK